MAFEFTLDPNFSATDHILFAYAQPFTRTDIDKGVQQFEVNLKEAFGNEIYFHKQVLVKSLEGHSMEYLTVTLQNGKVPDAQQPMDDQDFFVGDLVPDTKGEVLYPDSDQPGPMLF